MDVRLTGILGCYVWIEINMILINMSPSCTTREEGMSNVIRAKQLNHK